MGQGRFLLLFADHLSPCAKVRLSAPIYAPGLVKSTGDVSFCTCFHRLNRPTLHSVGDLAGNWSGSSSLTGRCGLCLNRPFITGLPAVEGWIEIENAFRARRECARPDWTRRFIRGLPEDAKFEASRGVIIDPAAVAGFGVTRRRKGGNARGREIRGNPEIQPLAQPRARIRGNPETCRRQCRKMRDLGRPKASSEAGREERGRGATRGFARPAPLKDARFGETRRSIADIAGRCRTRGDSRPHRKAAREKRRCGATRRFAWPAPLKDARFEETRRSIAGTARRCGMRGNLQPNRIADGAMHGSRSCEFTAIETPGTSVSGVFIFGAAFALRVGLARFQDALGSGL
jgi:hypothetical protein